VQILFVLSLRGPRMAMPDRISSNVSGEVLIAAWMLSGCIHITCDSRQLSCMLPRGSSMQVTCRVTPEHEFKATMGIL
jgi:hypothetical protein